MSGFTPGPWWPSRVHGTTYIEAKLVSDQRLLQEVAACGPTFTPTEQEANARLIAAAPDMLAALQAVLNDCDDLDMVESNESGRDVGPFELVYAAIAKATGAEP